MNAKKKLIITACSFAMVILAAVVAIIAVLAAQNVTIKSSINITYSADDIYGSVRTSYKLEGDADYTAWGETITFDEQTEQNSESTLDDPKFKLTSNKSYVIIKFDFKKKNADVDNFSVELQYSSTKATNIAVTYGTDEDNISNVATSTMFSGTEISTSADYTSLYVKIAIESVEKDADFSGDFTWSLSNISSN
jgi:hypothetical protein